MLSSNRDMLYLKEGICPCDLSIIQVYFPGHFMNFSHAHTFASPYVEVLTSTINEIHKVLRCFFEILALQIQNTLKHKGWSYT